MKYLFVSFLLCLSVQAYTQQNHFIYIQADNKQPFYIKLDKKVLSSSVSGYLIIPKLQEGTYDLSIGFPRNEWPEQRLTCNINKNDLGYLLKNFGEKGWGLFNFQTMDLVMADNSVKTDSSSIVKTKPADAFTDALANVVNDPKIKTVEEVKEDSVVTAKPIVNVKEKKADKPALNNKVRTKPVAVNYKKDRIAKLLSRRNADSLRMVYVDRVKGETDTINIVIPTPNPVVKAKPEKKVEKPGAGALAKAGNKKTEKKVKPAKVDLAKVENKDVIPVKDSTSIVQTEKKMEAPKVEPVKEDNKNAGTDTIAVIQPGQLIEALKGDLSKADNKNPEPVKDTTVVAQVEKKIEVPKIELVKEENKIPEPLKDTVAIAQVEKKVEETKVDSPKTDITAIIPVKDSAALNKPEVVKTITTPAQDSAIVSSTVQTDTTSKAVVTPDVAVVKKTEEVVVQEKPKEPVVEKPKEPVVEKPVTNAPKVVYAACKYAADGDEFLNLKKKMSKGTSDNQMLYYAHQVFIKRCFTTKQIERLSLLFDNDMAKYNLFDDAYHYTMDLENFTTLEAQLTDPYYIKRFKAMIRQ